MSFKSFEEAIFYLGKSGPEASSDCAKGEELYREMLGWLKYLNNSPVALSHLVPCKFIFDYRTSAMVYFSPSIEHLLGFQQETFLGAAGIIRFMDLINPNDFKVYNEQIFPKDINYMNSLPYEDSIRLTFSNNFRMKQDNGLYKTVLMKKCFVIDPDTRLPMYEFGILIDISSFKKELSITHSVDRLYRANDKVALVNVLTEDYFPDMLGDILSTREKEILTHLSLPSSGSK